MRSKIIIGMSSLHSAFVTVLALLAWSTLAVMLWLLILRATGAGNTPLAGLTSFFGYFTVLTNLLCASILTVHTIRPRNRYMLHIFLSHIALTSVAASMILVTTIYYFFLRHYWNLHGIHAVIDNIVHYVIPPAFLAYWWYAVPTGTLRWSDLPRTLIYPILYLCYVLVRGKLIGIYPYPFFDVIRIGYTQVLLNSGFIFTGYLTVCAVLIVANQRMKLVFCEDQTQVKKTIFQFDR